MKKNEITESEYEFEQILDDAKNDERLAARKYFDSYYETSTLMIEKKHIYKVARNKVDELELLK